MNFSILPRFLYVVVTTNSPSMTWSFSTDMRVEGGPFFLPGFCTGTTALMFFDGDGEDCGDACFVDPAFAGPDEVAGVAGVAGADGVAGLAALADEGFFLDTVATFSCVSCCAGGALADELDDFGASVAGALLRFADVARADCLGFFVRGLLVSLFASSLSEVSSAARLISCGSVNKLNFLNTRYVKRT